MTLGSYDTDGRYTIVYQGPIHIAPSENTIQDYHPSTNGAWGSRPYSPSGHLTDRTMFMLRECSFDGAQQPHGPSAHAQHRILGWSIGPFDFAFKSA